MSTLFNFFAHPTSGAVIVMVTALAVTLTVLYMITIQAIRLIAWIIFLPTLCWSILLASMTGTFDFHYTTEWLVVKVAVCISFFFAAILALSKNFPMKFFERIPQPKIVAMLIVVLASVFSLSYDFKKNIDKVHEIDKVHAHVPKHF